MVITLIFFLLFLCYTNTYVIDFQRAIWTTIWLCGFVWVVGFILNGFSFPEFGLFFSTCGIIAIIALFT